MEKTYFVSVIEERHWDLSVRAKSEDDAIAKVKDMNTGELFSRMTLGDESVSVLDAYEDE
jgi:hypothetical protein